MHDSLYAFSPSPTSLDKTWHLSLKQVFGALGEARSSRNLWGTQVLFPIPSVLLSRPVLSLAFSNSFPIRERHFSPTAPPHPRQRAVLEVPSKIYEGPRPDDTAPIARARRLLRANRPGFSSLKFRKMKFFFLFLSLFDIELRAGAGRCVSSPFLLFSSLPSSAREDRRRRPAPRPLFSL